MKIWSRRCRVHFLILPLIHKTHIHMTSSHSIKLLAEGDRPREKAIRHGIEALTDSELLAILIGSGIRGESAIDLSRRILSAVNNDLHRLAKYSVAQLLEFKGVGEARALSIASALELGRRRMRSSPAQYATILRSSDAFDVVVPYLTDKGHEEVWVLLLNQAGKLLHHQRVSSGGMTHAIVDTKVIMRLALQHSATRMILVHNHPSGSVKPSKHDIRLTEKVKHAAKLFDVELTDHLIVAQDRYFSFKDECIL